MRVPGHSWLLQETCQIGSTRVQEVATPGQQATDTQRIGGNLVAAHAAIAFLDPPANRALAGVIGAIEGFPALAFPFAIARQATPQVEADPNTRGAADRPGWPLPLS